MSNELKEKISQLTRIKDKLVEQLSTALDRNTELYEENKELKAKLAKRNKPQQPKLVEVLPEIQTNNQELKKAWFNFVADRKDRKAPLTKRAATIALNKLKGFTEQEALDALNEAVEKGYRGVFPKAKAKQQQSDDFNDLITGG